MSDWLIQRFSEFGERPFLATQEGTSDYASLHSQIHSYVEELTNAGVQAGDVVTLIGDYSLRSVAALLALFKIKVIAAPIASASADEAESRRQEAQANWQLEIKDQLNLTRFERSESSHDYLKSLARVGRAGLILFSSGSTGRPKAMIHDADRLLAPFQKKRTRKHRILIFLLFDHIGGLNTLFNGLATGALIVAPHSRDPSVVAEAIERHQVNLLPASPTFLNLLLMSGAVQNHDLSSLRCITYGTEPMPESLLHRIKTALPNISLIQTFGTSETGISQTVSRASDSTLIKFDDPDSEYRIMEGELWIRSKNQVLGYLNHNMDRFTPDGWFRTGDLVEEAADGFIKIIGRREDLINVGGEKVTPSEVESILLEIPEVMDCVVYSEDNAITGQIVAAKIVAAEDKDPKQLKRQIKQHCRAKLSPYKVPARITFCDKTTFNSRFKKIRRSES